MDHFCCPLLLHETNEMCPQKWKNQNRFQPEKNQSLPGPEGYQQAKDQSEKYFWRERYRDFWEI